MLLKIFNILVIIVFGFYLSLFILNYPSISNINGPTVGMLFLLTLSYIFNKTDHSKSYFLKTLNSIVKSQDKILVVSSVSVLFIILTSLSIARHFALSSCSSDLGIFDQAIWNTLNGDVLFSSIMGNFSLLGYHFYPILLFFVPFYELWPSPLVLLIIQSLLLASSIIPLYLIAKMYLTDRIIIFAMIISFVLSKPLRGVGLSDFHTECFILPALFWAYYFLIKKRNLLFFLTIFVLLLCKEDVTFLVAGFGLFTAFFQKRRGLGLGLFILGIAAWFIETKYIIPFFNPLGIYPYMDRLPFGLTYADNFKAVITNPALLGNLFFTGDKMEYVMKIFGPFAFLPLLSPAHYILIVIPLLKNLITTDTNFSGYYNITSHYTAAVIPFVFIAAIYGIRRLVNKFNNKNTAKAIGGIIIIAALFFYGKTDANKFWRFMKTIKEGHTLEKISYLKQVPPGVSVAANFNLVPHLSHRKYIFDWNPREKSSHISQYLVIDLTLLEYLGKEETAQIESYLQEIDKLGFKKILENPEKTFFIYHNPQLTLSPAENLYKQNR